MRVGSPISIDRLNRIASINAQIATRKAAISSTARQSAPPRAATDRPPPRAVCGAEKRRAGGGARSALRELTRRACLNGASAARAVSCATRPQTEQRRGLGPEGRAPDSARGGGRAGVARRLGCRHGNGRRRRAAKARSGRRPDPGSVASKTAREPSAAERRARKRHWRRLRRGFGASQAPGQRLALAPGSGIASHRCAARGYARPLRRPPARRLAGRSGVRHRLAPLRGTRICQTPSKASHGASRFVSGSPGQRPV